MLLFVFLPLSSHYLLTRFAVDNLKWTVKYIINLYFQKTSALRKYNGLTDTEIQNLLKSELVSDLYMKKLNQKIDTALRVGI